jgi:Raf kinase inhibitor-like YbhB/YbcL family protein
MIKQLCAVLVCLALSACFARAVPIVKGEKMTSIKITSAAFTEGEMIPAQYTCDGSNVSPPLAWDTVPAGTRSLALVADDPDAPMGTWVHWVAYNLPASVKELKEGILPSDSLPGGGRQGLSDFGKYGYGGPCPPGGTHRYFFKLYALDTALPLSGKVTKRQLEAAMKGHVLAQGELMGRYSRK